MTILEEAPPQVEEQEQEEEEKELEIDRFALLPIPPLKIIENSGVHAEVCEITPEIAAALLTHRRFQRAASQAVVNRYARDMLADNWLLTGEPLILSGADGWEIRDGHLHLRDAGGGYSDIETEDAQQRLLAVHQTKTTIQALVVWGIDPKARKAMNLGKTRTLVDVLGYADELGLDVQDVNRVTLASVAKRYAQIEETWRGERPYSPTISESMDWLADNLGMIQSVNLAEEYRESLPPLAKPDIIALVGYHLRSVFSAEAEDNFVRRFAKMSGLPEGHSFIVARDYLAKMGGKKKLRGTWKDQFRVCFNAASLDLADTHPVNENQVKTRPKGRAIPAPLSAEAHLGPVE